MRVYVIGRGYQASEIDTEDAARRFAEWLTADANPALAGLIHQWLWLPPDAGGLGALAECAWDVAVLRAAFIARCERGLRAVAAQDTPGTEPQDQADGQVRP